MGIKKQPLTFRQWIDHNGVESIAKKLNVDKTTIWNWRRGHCYPRVEQMRIIRQISKGAITYETIIDGAGL